MSDAAATNAEKRVQVRKKRAARERRQNQGIYPGINDLGDALEALPAEVVRHFTLLREIDAKCISMMPMLEEAMKKFFEFPANSGEATVREKRDEALAEVRRLIRELMPCQEEKMHVAGVAADAVSQHVARMDHDYDLIVKDEIPDYVRFGPDNHPAILTDKQAEPAKGAQTTRSESRREAIAAKKAAQTQDGKKTNSNNSGRNTPVNGQRQKPGPKPKAKPNTPQPANASLSVNTNKRRRNDDDEENTSRPDTPNSHKRSRQRGGAKPKDEDNKVYCYCQQVSFGDMVGCDGPDCKVEWFHLPCIGLDTPPKGQWYCEQCIQKRGGRR